MLLADCPKVMLPNGVTANSCYNHPPLKKTVVVQTAWVNWREVFRDDRPDRHSRHAVMVELPDDMSKDCRFSIRYGNEPRCAGCIWNQYPQLIGETGMNVTGMEHAPAALLELDPTTHHAEPIQSEAVAAEASQAC